MNRQKTAKIAGMTTVKKETYEPKCLCEEKFNWQSMAKFRKPFCGSINKARILPLEQITIRRVGASFST